MESTRLWSVEVHGSHTYLEYFWISRNDISAYFSDNYLNFIGNQNILNMKFSAILLLLLGLTFIQCDKDSGDDDSTMCAKLQQDVDEALNQKLATFEAYTQNPSDPESCINYKNALQNRVEKLKAQRDAGCVPKGAEAFTEQAIEEDETEINNLAC